MLRRVYLTHCSAKKNELLKGTNKKVTPDKLYTSTRAHRFMKICREKDVNWGIFSDNYGIWFKNVKNSWYEKSPNSVTDVEFNKLVTDFDRKLKGFDEIWFYYYPGRFHPLYRKLLKKTTLKLKIRKFTHLSEISI